MRRFLSWANRADPSYSEMFEAYTKADGIVMLIFWALQTLIMTLSLYVIIFHFQSLFLVIIVPLILTAIAIVFVKARKQSLATVGVTTKNFFISLLVALGLGIPLFAINGRWQLFIEILGLDGGLYALLIRFLYHMIVISLGEELIYRGYLQTRMKAVVKNSFLSVFIVGVMFGIAHLPIILLRGGELSSFFMRGLWFYVLFHWILNHLYKRYNSLVAPIILHTLYNIHVELEIIRFRIIFDLGIFNI